MGGAQIFVLATQVDATLVAAFAVGFISFVSPCVLPLVPGYLSTISGVSFAEIQAGNGRSKVLGPAVLFCLSFTVMFVALGMTATGFGSALQDNRRELQQVAGVVLVAMGGLFIATLFADRLNREWRPEALLARTATGGPIVAGLAFAVAWLPCTGPTLGAILTAAGTEQSVGQGGMSLSSARSPGASSSTASAPTATTSAVPPSASLGSRSSCTHRVERSLEDSAGSGVVQFVVTC